MPFAAAFARAAATMTAKAGVAVVFYPKSGPSKAVTAIFPENDESVSLGALEVTAPRRDAVLIEAAALAGLDHEQIRGGRLTANGETFEVAAARRVASRTVWRLALKPAVA